MSDLTRDDIGVILDLFIDEKISEYNPGPTEFGAAIEQVWGRYNKEHGRSVLDRQEKTT